MKKTDKTMLTENTPIVNRDKLIAWRDEYHAEQKARASRRKYWTHYIVSDTHENTCDHITDTATEYLSRAARVMAYTAIKTAYVRSGHPYLWTLLQSANSDRRRNGQFALVHDVTTTTDSAYRAILAITDDSNTLQVTKTHKRRKMGGVWVPVHDEYLATTDTGKAFHAAMAAETNIHLDYDDCVSVAFLAIWERIDTFKEWGDVWQVRRYVYRAVNQYLHEQRKTQDEMTRFTQYVTFTDDDGNERDVTAGQADRAIKEVLDNDVLSSVIAFVCSAVRKDAAENMRIVLSYRLAGYTTREIAKARGHADDKATRRLLSRARAILSDADGVAFLRSIF